MNKKTKSLVLSLTAIIALGIFVVPLISFAAGLVPCDTGESCDFTALLTLVNKVITFILVDLALPIAAIMFAYAGFLMITAGGEAAHARTKAKNIFTNAIIGLILAVAGWLIVSTILTLLGYDGTWIGLVFGL